MYASVQKEITFQTYFINKRAICLVYLYAFWSITSNATSNQILGVDRQNSKITYSLSQQQNFFTNLKWTSVTCISQDTNNSRKWKNRSKQLPGHQDGGCSSCPSEGCSYHAYHIPSEIQPHSSTTYSLEEINLRNLLRSKLLCAVWIFWDKRWMFIYCLKLPQKLGSKAGMKKIK